MSNIKLGWLPVGTAVLAFFGALLGTYISGLMQEDLWKKTVLHEKRRTIFTERVKLVERVSKAINQGTKAESLQVYAQEHIGIRTQKVHDCKVAKKSSPSSGKCHAPEIPVEILRLIHIQSDLTAELVSSVELASLYFGPKTRKAADAFMAQQPWWDATESALALINAMKEELRIDS